ncbi:MAG: pseudouridine synthase [Eubacteriales bacterium]|nr:pseudouridine synthase [Eubacteriales bacterium]
MERIDKIISSAKNISRKDASQLIKQGKITVNGKTVKSPKEKFDEKSDVILCGDEKIEYNEFVYIMMNKPKGVISASEGKSDLTVIDILPKEMKRKNLFPAGRLDKDTTGFMLVTDDGDFAHRILSPKNHIEKTYIADLDKPFNDIVAADFENGIELKDAICMPACIEALDGDFKKAVVTIKQGMYHQIKRMFKKHSITVVDLKRIKMGGLSLDSSLNEGECRYITPEELKIITGEE